jgi:hypothetical protein
MWATRSALHLHATLLQPPLHLESHDTFLFQLQQYMDNIPLSPSPHLHSSLYPRVPLRSYQRKCDSQHPMPIAAQSAP